MTFASYLFQIFLLYDRTIFLTILWQFSQNYLPAFGKHFFGIDDVRNVLTRNMMISNYTDLSKILLSRFLMRKHLQLKQICEKILLTFGRS